MKRTIAAISLLAVLLLGSMLASWQMQCIHTPLAAALTRSAAADPVTAESMVQQARQTWEKYRKFTAAFADHTPMEEIDFLFASLDAYSAESEEYGAICLELSRRLDAIVQSHQPTWWNLL